MLTVLFTACTKEKTPIVNQIVTINATIVGDTKVTLGADDEKKVNWTDGDIINLTINEVEYPFTWQEGTTFAYTGDKTLPTLAHGTQITAEFADAYNITQTGLKADVGNYMALSADKTVTTEEGYGDLNLTFSHGTSVLKLILSNDTFKGANVTDIALKAGGTVVAKTSETIFTGDAVNGSVTVYLALRQGSLTNVTIHATCASKEYITTMSDKTLVSGKIYNANVEVSMFNDYIDEYGINHGKGTEIDGIVWAPVNCGYHQDDFKYGKLYQWGRKYGQGYSGNLYNVNGSNVGTYSDATVPTLSKGGVSEAVGTDKSYANIFYYNYYDWLYFPNDWLWNSGTESAPVKTDYDPCPSGWRVPTYAELDELCGNRSSWTTNSAGQVGYWFSGVTAYTSDVPQVFFPAAGLRNSNSGNASNRGYAGGYWSSRPSGTNAYRLYFNSSNSLMGSDSYNRAYGYSVRCVQE